MKHLVYASALLLGAGAFPAEAKEPHLEAVQPIDLRALPGDGCFAVDPFPSGPGNAGRGGGLIQDRGRAPHPGFPGGHLVEDEEGLGGPVMGTIIDNPRNGRGRLPGPREIPPPLNMPRPIDGPPLVNLPPVDTPEPGTWLLIGGVLATLGVRGFTRGRF
jgi:hypothetical protein